MSAHLLVCPKCNDGASSDVPAAECVFTCSVCNLRVAYGEMVPRIVIEPDGEKLRTRIYDPLSGECLISFAYDARRAARHAQELISLVVLGE